MRVAAEFVGAKQPEPFMAFWENVKVRTNVEPPDKDALRRFNELRVNFKHLGIMPHPGDAADLLPIVENFCHEIAKIYLDTDFDSISLADLIPNEKARNQVKEAEAAFAGKDVQGAFLAISLAFYELSVEAYRKPGLAIDKIWRWGGVPSDWPKEMTDHTHSVRLDWLAETLDELAGAINSLALGMNPQRLRRFQHLIPHILQTEYGPMTARWDRSPTDLGEKDFRFCLHFVIDLALQLATST